MQVLHSILHKRHILLTGSKYLPSSQLKQFVAVDSQVAQDGSQEMQAEPSTSNVPGRHELDRILKGEIKVLDSN